MNGFRVTGQADPFKIGFAIRDRRSKQVGLRLHLFEFARNFSFGHKTPTNVRPKFGEILRMTNNEDGSLAQVAVRCPSKTEVTSSSLVGALHFCKFGQITQPNSPRNILIFSV